MRTLLFAAFALAGLVGTAIAQPVSSVPAVEITVGPDLAKKASEDYGSREIDRLTIELRKDVERELARTGVLAGGRVELTLVDVKPNRPTMKQLGDRPGLSYESFGVGGVKIEGRAVSLDGEITPIRYSWYETDIRDARYGGTWSDAERGFNQFASRLGRGTVYARR